MKAVFVELPAFARHRARYLDDEDFAAFQLVLMQNPLAGDVIQGTGGLRKIRWSDRRRGKGKRGGLRIIYYWWDKRCQYWLFTLYSKDEAADLNTHERNILANMLNMEIKART